MSQEILTPDLAIDPKDSRSTVTLSKDQKCPICHERFLTDEMKLAAAIMADTRMGTVHTECFMPFHPENGIRLAFEIPCYSIGDTIATTPVLRELRRIYPSLEITVLTFYPDLFKYSPHVNAIVDFNQAFYKEIVDSHHFKMKGFDSTGRHHFAMHSVEFAAQSALSRSIDQKDWQYEVNYSRRERDSALEVLRAAGIDPDRDRLILLHPHGTEWPTRDWGPQHMQELAARLALLYPNARLVSIGGKRGEVPKREMTNYVPLGSGVIDLYGKLSLLESIALMDLPCARLLITPDTGTLHLGACASDLSIIGIFTLIRSWIRTPVRDGLFGYRFMGIEAESGCNCTYDAKVLTSGASFNRCPKLSFLEDTLRSNMPADIKAEGLRNFNRDRAWDPARIGSQIRAEMAQYQRKSLPCFPTVDQVLGAVREMLIP